MFSGQYKGCNMAIISLTTRYTRNINNGNLPNFPMFYFYIFFISVSNFKLFYLKGILTGFKMRTLFLRNPKEN